MPKAGPQQLFSSLLLAASCIACASAKIADEYRGARTLQVGDANIRQQLRESVGQPVCVRGVLTADTGGVYYRLPQADETRIYGESVDLEMRFVDAYEQGMRDQRTYTFCGALHDREQVDALGESQNSYLLRDAQRVR